MADLPLPRVLLLAVSLLSVSSAPVNAASLYDLSAVNIHGVHIDLSKLRGTVSLVINVASFCGLTERTYRELVQLSERFKGRNFNILAFPCNQFNSQEPKSNREIYEFARNKFGAKFLMFAKTTVNDPTCPAGVNAEEDVCSPSSSACCPANVKIFRVLKSAIPGDIEWNFGKFLVDKDGRVIQRYPPEMYPLSLADDIESALRTAEENLSSF